MSVFEVQKYSKDKVSETTCSRNDYWGKNSKVGVGGGLETSRFDVMSNKTVL